ncbi:hypothetical protein ASESINO_211 [Erwinia phage vB_EamM_Asesino]|uniref:Uncharacterized protein n=1 Tax=Erwinia phage vB_EamM_Asesino TaxID=1883370 RepID=A0A1B2IAH4_9CAUD|nr:hypothetical protein ASESINO_211 [Erwinia phage vB_EamM_Asesino]ANZ48224.1 hypothetical protein ASESINO_211 [Erwinia phage vB_EamM_Asesino]
MPEVSRPVVKPWRGSQMRAANMARQATPKRHWKIQRR